MTQAVTNVRLTMELILGAIFIELLLMQLLPALHVNATLSSAITTLTLLALLTPWAVRRYSHAKRTLEATPTSAPPKPGAKAALVFSYLVLVGGCLVSLWGSNAITERIEQDAKSRFERQSARIALEIAHRFNLPLYGLQAAHGLREAQLDGHVDRRAFRAFVAALDVDHHFQGIRGFGLIQHVQRANLDSFVQAERADGAPEFQVKTKGSAPDLYIITQIEPVSRNSSALGLDVGSEAVRREGIERAIATGKPTLTNPITLVQDSLKRAGLLFYYPYYKAGARLDTVEHRRAALAGVHYNPIVLDELLAGLMDVANRQIDIDLSINVPGQKAPQPLYTERLGTPVKSPRYSAHQQLAIGDRTWDLHLHSNVNLDATIDTHSPAWLAAGGMLLSVLLSLAMWLMGSGRARAESMASQMTTDLDRLAQVVKLTDNAVMITDTDSRITWVNDGFTRLYGYTLDEIRGRTPASLLSTGKLDAHQQDTLEVAKQLGNGCRSEFLNRTKNGHEVWVDNEVQPIRTPTGRITGYIEIDQDVTELKKTTLRLKAAIRESEAMLRTINTQSIVSIADRAGRITEVNDAFVQISGYLREELIGKDHRIVNSGYHPKDFWAQMWGTISHGNPWRGEIRNKAKDGSHYWVDSMIAPFVGADGKIEKYISIRTDITQRKEAEQELRASKALLDRAGRIAGIGGWQLDLETDQMTWSDHSYRIHERSPSSHLTRAEAAQLLTPASRNTLDAAAKVACLTGKPWDLELEEITISGRHIWVRSVGEAEFEYGKPVRLIGAFQDITERKMADLRQQETSSLLTKVLGAASEISVIATDPNLVIKVFNHGAERMLGYAAEEMIGFKTPAVIHDLDEVMQRAQDLSTQIGKPVEGPQVFIERSVLGMPREWTYVRKDGSRLLVSLVVTAMQNDRGDITGYLGIARDITQQHAYEDSLRQATARAEQANIAKSQFLANMSHEIRTPMNAILGMLRLLNKTSLTPRQLDYTRKTEGAAKSLLGLLNDILDFSKVEAGKMTLDIHPFEVEHLLSDLAVILSANVGVKPVEVLFDLDPALPHVLLGDALRLQQVLINLGGNAIKFTQSGEVVLGVKVLPATTRDTLGTLLRFSVRDTGIGIAPEAIQRIFEGFSQAENSTTRKFGGTGLGLSISQRLVGLMGGQLKVDSEQGKGSTFYFDVVMNEPDSTAKQDVQPESTRVRRVLIVDDNATARRVLSAMVESLNWRADLAEGGQEALRQLREAAERGEHYDAVFMDWQMPGMDGWQTSQHIRDCALQERPPMIVMVTAHGKEDLVQRTTEDQSLIDAYLVKPVTARMLESAVNHLMEGTTGSSQRYDQAPTPGSNSLEGMKVLLVEDNLNNQQIAVELLSDEGAQLQIANNGQEAVDAVAAPNAHFDIILMDLQMPVMDGLEATRTILQQHGAKAPPIVAMTANAMHKDRRESLAAGMVDHVGKPFDLDQLINVLRKHTGRSIAGSTSRARPAVSLPDEILNLAAERGIDVATAIDRLGGRRDVYTKLLSSFLKDLDEATHKIDTLWQQRDTASLAQWLHTIKGLAGTLGNQPLAAVLAEGESASKEPQTKDIGNWIESSKACLTKAIDDISALLAVMQDEPQVDQSSQPSAADMQAFDQQCQTLIDLLQRADMSATDHYAQMHECYGSALGAALAPLDEAMSKLDFAEAVTQCSRLIERIKQE